MKKIVAQLLKNFLVVAFLVTALLVIGPRSAQAGTGGLSVFDISPASGTAAFLVDSGAGQLFDVFIPSGTTGNFAVCYDSASASGFTPATPTAGTTTAPQLALVYVGSVPYNSSFPTRSVPIKYTNGLVCGQGSALSTKIYYSAGD